MKILLVTDAYKHLTNGVAIVVKTLESAYREMGHEVRVLTVSGDSKGHIEDNVFYMPAYKVPLYPDFRVSLVRRHPFLDYLIRWKPDIVHIHSEASARRMAMSVAKAVGAPVIMTWHTDYAKFAFHQFGSLPPVKFAASSLMKVLYRDAAITTVPSYKAKGIMDGYNVGLKNTVIPNGIDLARFQKEPDSAEAAAIRKKFRIAPDRKILVILSRLSAEKNISELLYFFPPLLRRDPKLHLLIAGTGPDTEHLKQLSQKLLLTKRVTFTGFVEPEETYKYYKLGVAFMSASTFEMHSLTYLEAMACGLPLICRDDPCLQGVLDDGENGFIYRDRDEFVEKTLRLVSDDDLRRRMSEKALERSLCFSNETFAKNMLKLYEDVIGRRSPGTWT